MPGKHMWCVVGVLTVLALIVGCRSHETPGTKQARLIAAQNRELSEQLSERDAEIARLKAQYAEDIARRDEELATCRRRIESLRADLAKRVDSVMASVMAENARLRREIESLKAKTTNDTP